MHRCLYTCAQPTERLADRSQPSYSAGQHCPSLVRPGTLQLPPYLACQPCSFIVLLVLGHVYRSRHRPLLPLLLPKSMQQHIIPHHAAAAGFESVGTNYTDLKALLDGSTLTGACGGVATAGVASRLMRLCDLALSTAQPCSAQVHLTQLPLPALPHSCDKALHQWRPLAWCGVCP